MLIIPAIDIKNGKCVRLLQGDPDKETIYSDDPVAMAKQFQDAGAELIHVVDLDGAFQGTPVNRELVVKIGKSIDIPIEIGGGIRTAGDVSFYHDAGIKRIILGTVILQEECGDLVNEFKDILVAGIDARDSMVATHGWKNVSTSRADTVIREIMQMGINEIIYTDIATDGMLSGPNFGALEKILADFRDIRLIASGGVSSMKNLEDLYALKQKGLKGCIVGKAIYDGRVDLEKAVKNFGN